MAEITQTSLDERVSYDESPVYVYAVARELREKTELTEVIKEISEPYQVKVQIKLESEVPKLETFPSDYY